MNITEQTFRLDSHDSKKWASLVEKLHADLSLRQVETTPWFNYLAEDVLSRQLHGEHQKDSKESASNHQMKPPRFKLRRIADRPFNISYLLYRNIPSEAREEVINHPKRYKGKSIYLSKDTKTFSKFISLQCDAINIGTVASSIKTFPSLLNVEPFIEEIEDGYNLELELMAYSESDNVYVPKKTVFPPYDSSYLYDLVKQEHNNDKQKSKLKWIE